MSENVLFSARQLRFIEWLATPKAERYPQTQEELAPELGVTSRTLRRWKTPELGEAVTRRARELLSDDLPEIYATLRREAIKGSFQHIKLAMEMAGEYTERHEQRNLNIDISTLDEGQLERIANGEDPVHVLATSGQGGVGTTPTAGEG